jgi:UrcA family protein
MNSRNSVILAITSLSVFGAGSVLARQSAPAPATHEIIQVQARSQVRHELLPLNQGEAEVLKASVHYGDLDLKSDAGARELEARIAEAANDVCTTLADMYPESRYHEEVSPPEATCARRATKQAMAAARMAIDKARGARG